MVGKRISDFQTYFQQCLHEKLEDVSISF